MRNAKNFNLDFLGDVFISLMGRDETGFRMLLMSILEFTISYDSRYNCGDESTYFEYKS